MLALSILKSLFQRHGDIFVIVGLGLVVFFYHNYLTHRISSQAKTIVELTSALQKAKTTSELLYQHIERQNLIILKSNEQATQSKNIMIQATTELATLTNQYNNHVKRIIQAPVPATCTAAIDYLITNAKQLSQPSTGTTP